LLEERANGIKSRGIYETPGGFLLHFALKQLKQLCWGQNLFRLASYLSAEYGQLVYDGNWHSESRHSLEAFFARASINLTGFVGIRIVGSETLVTERSSPFGLYNASHVSFEEDSIGFNAASGSYTLFATYPNKMAGIANKSRQ
jgi:argininosuccinate synthase